MTGRVVHDGVNGVLFCVLDPVVVRGEQGRGKVNPLGYDGAPLEVAGILPCVAAYKAAGPGNIVIQAAGSAVIALGGVENLGAEGNRVFPGNFRAAGIVAVVQGEPDDRSANDTFCCRHAPQREGLA